MTEVTLRTHDAMWILEREIAFNEYLLAKGRKRAPQRQPCDITLFFNVDLDPTEQTSARTVLAGAAAGCGMQAGAFKTVLDVLGLLPERPTVTTLDSGRRRKYGQCRKCLRRCVALRKDGTLVGHSRLYDVPVSEARCDGGGTFPVISRKAAAA
ncbi:hypothetical protein ABZ912_19830 [Nonomuraea angiospora]|uniref:hypothetical protein n=1 Tax=Nonomuraea angiospora TaxID=46172 RepID=UPI003401F9ED